MATAHGSGLLRAGPRIAPNLTRGGHVVTDTGHPADRRLDELVQVAHRVSTAVETVISGKPDGGPAGADRPARRGARAHRGRARRGQDAAGQGAGPVHRLLGPPRPVHARPAAQRHHRGQRLQPGAAGVRVQAGPDLRQHRARRRDQPGLAQDPVRAAGVHGGAPGHGGRRHLPARAAVHGDRHPEPGRDGGHLPAAGGAARPVHRPDLHRLPRPGRRAGDAGLARVVLAAGRAQAGRARQRHPGAGRGGARACTWPRRSGST